jgi:16S rRNA processing protein RimM
MISARKKNWVECGRVGRPWGIKGDLVVEWYSGETPVEPGTGDVYTQSDSEYISHRILSSRRHGKAHVVRIDGISSRSGAIGLRGATFFLPEDELPQLNKGEYYSYQILGLDVVTTGGDKLGKVTKIFSAGGHDVYEVTGEKDGKKHQNLIPAVGHIVLNIDIEKGEITINPMEGLLD